MAKRGGKKGDNLILSYSRRRGKGGRKDRKVLQKNQRKRGKKCSHHPIQSGRGKKNREKIRTPCNSGNVERGEGRGKAHWKPSPLRGKRKKKKKKRFVMTIWGGKGRKVCFSLLGEKREKGRFSNNECRRKGGGERGGRLKCLLRGGRALALDPKREEKRNGCKREEFFWGRRKEKGFPHKGKALSSLLLKGSPGQREKRERKGRRGSKSPETLRPKGGGGKSRFILQFPY